MRISGLLKQPRQTRLVVLSVLSLIVIGTIAFKSRTAQGRDQDLRKLNRFVQTAAKTDTPALKMFREGRDLIEAQSWEKAAEKFRGFITGFPRDKDVDAALYWYAYALHKQGKKEAAVEPLLRLIKSYSSSSWRNEAQALLVELGQGNAVQEALDQSNCEIKVLALQSLFEADEDRALTFVDEVLKSTSSECPSLKGAAVSLLGSYGGARATPVLLGLARSHADLKLRLIAIRRLGEQREDNVAVELAGIFDSDRTKEIRAQIVRALSEMRNPRAGAKLIEIARSADDLAVRHLAIRYLGNRPEGLDELLRIFDSDRTPEIRSQILRALSDSDDPRVQAKLLEVARSGETPALRMEAIRRLGSRGQKSFDDLLALYATEKDLAIKMGLTRAYAEMNDPRAVLKLFEIAKGADSPELRVYAIRRLGEKTDDRIVEQLAALYDSETDTKVKGTLVRAFGDSDNKLAVRKLMAIARNDSSLDLRKLAVRMLGDSKDPEALKFLEDLLK